MHPLLQRQIRRQLGSADAVPECVTSLLEVIDQAYRQNDEDRALLERSLEMMSQEMLQANSQMRAMLQATPDVFVHVAIDGTVLDCKNDPISALFCSKQDETSRRLTLEQGFLERFEAAVDELLRGQPMVCFDISPSQARERIFEVRIVMVFLDQAIIYLRDITEAKKTEQQLRESEERHRTVFDRNPHPLWVYDAETLAFLAVNAAAIQHYGYSREEFLRMTIKDIRPLEHVPELMRMLLENPDTEEPSTCGVFRHRKRDGTEIDVEISSSRIVFGGRDASLILAVDVTEKLCLERERERMQRQLDQAHRLASLGHIGATMAHEFNNVLMGIQPFAEAMARAHPDSAAVRAGLQRISTAVKRGKRVTAEILSFTREETVTRKPLAVGPWLDDLIAEATAVLPSDIVVELNALEPLAVLGDGARLQQIFLNLITNARDAIGGVGKITLQVRRGSANGVYPFGVVTNGETFAHFTLTDSGSGISRDALKHVFEPLFTTKRAGTGLGLAVTHRIVQQHDGQIFIESEEGVGTSIHIFLPLTTATAAEAEPAVVVPIHVHTVTIIEDDAAVATGLACLLEEEGLEVAVATTGASAIGEIGRSQPDVVLLDVGLPDINGIDLYAQIAERWPSMPVIFSTGHADLSLVRSLTKHPNVGYLLKPYQIGDLLGILATLVPAA